MKPTDILGSIKLYNAVQIEERKEGITTVYKKFKKDITELT